ncbi:MAG: hypothetical protein HON47_01580 [Candidatus Diapherotrites archaeon]|jgi:hypothetical protein|uniref:Uncharacterized protein n=1 Tax=Candidatus Iainarchaeum sp. TaxID=3101447 RepID=A0A8T5GDZ1_9ARCH|nr:hypothetical protein [Candidatus Diapherotrites archaeon]MBT7241340.1 hypothetical protein [Candidatus Diapherotrites archaeon]
MTNEKIKQNKTKLKKTRNKKEEAAERAWKKGFQTTMERDILDAGKK